MNLSPVIVFTYNRPDYLKQTILSLAKNVHFSQSKVIVFSDGPKDETDIPKVNEIRKWLNNERLCKGFELKFHDENQGLANSIINGVSTVISVYKKAIILEDDLITSMGFLDYINKALEHFESYSEVGSVTGFSYPPRAFKIPKAYDSQVYFSYRPSSLGWATWYDRWDKVDWSCPDVESFFNDNWQMVEFEKGGGDLVRMLRKQINGELDSWAIRWTYHHYLKQLKAVYPVKSFVNHIGFDIRATHAKGLLINSRFINELDNSFMIDHFPEEIVLNSAILRRFKRIFARKTKYLAMCKYLMGK
jgi:glycosyltransferase involved in cell wall biosynthesis